uniref:Uncharacterized protein n=2 Tax=unclassified Prevotella TaxID=2638335 RepID=A0AB33JCI9_9BACT
MQVGGFHYLLQSMVEFIPRFAEEPRKFSLSHGNLSVSFANDLHIAAPIKVTTMIVRAIFAL